VTAGCNFGKREMNRTRRPALSGIFNPARGSTHSIQSPHKDAIEIASISRDENMKVIRRELLYLGGIAAALPAMSKIAWGQAQAGPKLTQILRKDLENQDQVVQETVVSVVDFGPGTAAPWHMHPGAQELLHVIEGSLVVEIEGGETTLLKTGEAAIIHADIVHLARNENTGASAKALVVHSRASKDKPLIVVKK
jgi:quercetin dioxygenase-like cupin family protein